MANPNNPIRKKTKWYYLRKKAGLTMKRSAELAKCAHVTITQIEVENVRQPSLDLQIKLTAIYCGSNEALKLVTLEHGRLQDLAYDYTTHQKHINEDLDKKATKLGVLNKTARP